MSKIEQRAESVNATSAKFAERKRSRFIVAVGRGGKGKSWLLRTLIEAAIARGKNITVVDADPGNRTLNDSLEGRLTILQPPDRSESERVRMIRDVVGLASKKPMLIFGDLGGNDQSLAKTSGQTLSSDRMEALSMFGLDEEGEIDLFEDVDVTVLYPISNDPHDINQIDFILNSPLRGKDIVLVLVDGLVAQVDPGAGDPWEQIKTTKSYQAAIAAGAKVVHAPALPVHIIIKLVRSGATFRDAIREKSKPLGTDPETGQMIAPLHNWERQAFQTYLAEFALAMRAAALEDKIG